MNPMITRIRVGAAIPPQNPILAFSAIHLTPNIDRQVQTIKIKHATPKMEPDSAIATFSA
jgi:hypothetical protein